MKPLLEVDWAQSPVLPPTRIGTFSLETIATPEGLAELGKELCEMAKAEFELFGTVSQSLLVYCRKDPQGVHEGPVVYRTGVKPGPEHMTGHAKDLAARLARVIVHHGQAVAFAHICEMWLFQSKGLAEQKRLERWRDAHNGSFEGCPGVLDTVGVFLETMRGTRQYTALIHTDPLLPARRTLGEFADKGMMVKGVGRFVSVLGDPAKKPN